MNTCHCGYTGKRSLYEHLFYEHSYTKQQIEEFKRERRFGKLTSGSNSVRTCRYCDEVFASSFSIGKHIKSAHPEKYAELLPKVSCPLCEERYENHRELVHHAQNSHANSPDQYSIKIITFPNIEQYKKWRRITEGIEITRHTIVSSKKRSGGVRVKYLRCNRACLNTKEKAISRKTTKKVVPFCTAFMKVTERETEVEVEYCSTHLGHAVEPELLRLDEDLEKYIVSLLKKGHPCRAIYKMIKEEAAHRVVMQRVTPRKIWLIAKKHALRPVDLQRKQENGEAIIEEEGEKEEHYDFMDTLEDVVMTSERVVDESTQQSTSSAGELSSNTDAESLAEKVCESMGITELEVKLSKEKSALDLLAPEQAEVPVSSSVDEAAQEQKTTETKVETSEEKSALDSLSLEQVQNALDPELCDSKNCTRAEDLMSSDPVPDPVKAESQESLEFTDEVTERKPSDEVVFKSETFDNNKDVIPMEETIDYKLPNSEVLGRIEKIIMGFHTDVLQIASQSDRISYKTLNKALRAIEAARALTQSTASKISKESSTST